VSQCEGGDGRAYFERAIALARRREARGLELRAALSAGRASLKRGEREQARRLIAPVCQGFDAQLTDPDLRDAQELMESLDAS